MLAELAGDLKTVAVAGTHGKTTTSSMTAAALIACGLDPTFLIGGELNDVGSNARCGTGQYYVVEADESDGSFLLLDPYCAIVTNVEADHLDHYGSLAEIVATFVEFLARLRPDGVAVLCADDPILPGLAAACPRACRHLRPRRGCRCPHDPLPAGGRGHAVRGRRSLTVRPSRARLSSRASTWP